MNIKKVVLSGYSPVPHKLSLGTYESYGVEHLEIVPGLGWDGLTITATFVTPAGRVRVVVPENGIIAVPQEATVQTLTTTNPGKIVFAGVSGGVQRISTDVVYTVAAHSPVDGSDPAPTPSEWEQYVERLKGVVSAAVPPTDTAGLVLHSGGTDAPNYWADGGIKDYNQLLNKPQINGVELAGDKSWEDLGLPDVAALAQAAAQSAQEAADEADAAGSASTAAADSASAAQSSATTAAAKAEESESSAQSALQSASSATQSATAAGQSAAAAEGSAQQAAGSASSAADAAIQAEAAAGKIPDPSGTTDAYLASNADGTGYTLVPTSQIVQEVEAVADTKYAPLESAICPVAVGNPAAIKHTLDFPIQSIKILGLCTQAEVPQNGNVVPIQKFEGGTIDVEVTDGAGKSAEVQVECNSRLLGIPSSNFGNLYLGDYIDPETGHVMSAYKFIDNATFRDLIASITDYNSRNVLNIMLGKSDQRYPSFVYGALAATFSFRSFSWTEAWTLNNGSGSNWVNVPREVFEPYGYNQGLSSEEKLNVVLKWVDAQPNGFFDIVVAGKIANTSDSPVKFEDTGIVVDLSPLKNLTAYAGQTIITTTAGTAAEFSAIVNGYQWLEERLTTAMSNQIMMLPELYNTPVEPAEEN